ncbi:MAG: hypothetical protein IJ581_03140 [Paludibacteraceae bacterium]|nr:hypothetical protein [Paludibacteraceae bacterium]
MEKTAGSDIAPTSSVSEALEGATVTVTAGIASTGYYFSGWTASPDVTFADASATTTTFTMPAAAVTITANYGAIVSSTFNYGVSGDGEITSCVDGESATVANGATVTSGTSLILTAAAHTNYVFTGWTASGVDITGHASDNPITISMPATEASLTANFATITNKIATGATNTISDVDNDGTGTLTITNVDNFETFGHNVLKFEYSNMSGTYQGKRVDKDGGYTSSSSAYATGFGFYYKTEKADDHVAFCFEVSSGNQVKWQLAATNNVWKYYYFDHAGAANWNGEGIIIFMNGSDTGNHGEDNGKTTTTGYPTGGAFYISEIAATTVTSRPDIDEYTYTRTVTSGNYGTLCLPMAGTIDNATLYTIAGTQTEAGTDYIVLEEQGTDITAGTPYIFQSSAATITATMPAAPERDHVDGALVGSYVEEEILDNTGNYYFLRNNQFYQVHADDHVSVRAYGAYIDMSKIGAYTPAPGKRYVRMAVSSETDQAQGLTEQQTQPAVTKVLENGVIYILRDGRRYTILGQ